MSEVLGPRGGMSEIRDDILTDIVLECIKAGIQENVGPNSDNWAWATGAAGACALLHARVDGIRDAITPLNARGDDLIRHRDALGLPPVDPSRAAGKIVVGVAGTSSIPDGTLFTLPNGLQGRVVGTWSGVVDGSEIDVIVDTPGSRGNLGPGEIVTFRNPPMNVQVEARVSGFHPITGGFDEEDEERLRERVLNRMGTNPGGGNWGQLRELAFNASPAVQQCYVFPAIAGPSNAKVVPMKRFDRERYDFSRTFPAGALILVQDAIFGAVSTAINHKIQASQDEPVDVALQIQIPQSTLAGGSGEGWSDLQPWPTLNGDSYVEITAVAADGTLTVSALTSTAPIAGQNRVGWWSPNDMRFHVRSVTAVGGSAGAWEITPDAPFVDSRGLTPQLGDWISPAAENLAEYGSTWLDILEQLGCGENTSDPNLIANGRALRHPFTSEGNRSALTTGQLRVFESRHPEIEDISYSYRSRTAPTVPANVTNPPNVLTPRSFGVYPA